MSEYNQHNQSVENQFNIGRDQIIHNLVLVGRFLDFAKIEELIPKSATPTDFASVTDAFEKTFSGELDPNLTQALIFAGDTLKDAMVKWLPKEPHAALPINSILYELPGNVYEKLSKLNYWGAYAQWLMLENAQVLWLHSLSSLWKKHFKGNKLFGIEHRTYEFDGKWKETSYFCIKYMKPIDIGKHLTMESAMRFDTGTVTYDQFRIMMAGLVIDLIRLYSIGADDVKFWQGLIDFLSTNIQK